MHVLVSSTTVLVSNNALPRTTAELLEIHQRKGRRNCRTSQSSSKKKVGEIAELLEVRRKNRSAKSPALVASPIVLRSKPWAWSVAMEWKSFNLELFVLLVLNGFHLNRAAEMLSSSSVAYMLLTCTPFTLPVFVTYTVTD